MDGVPRDQPGCSLGTSRARNLTAARCLGEEPVHVTIATMDTSHSPENSTSGGPPAEDTTTRLIALTATLIGLAAIAILGFVGSGNTRAWVASVAVSALVVAVIAGSLWISAGVRTPTQPPEQTAAALQHKEGYIATLVVSLLTAAAAQTWFTWGRSVAGGDISPPEGTAWLAHIFAPWAWTSSNLGIPNVSERQLPWAAILFLSHTVGASAWLAQRLWLTLLFTAAAIAALTLLRVLGIRPMAAGVGALAYVFNPYVLSSVGINDVFLSAMVLVAAYPAIVLAAARGRISIRSAVILLAAGSPLVGFAYSNPPLAILIAIVTATSALLAGWLWGRRSARLAGVALLKGGAAALAVSSYWIVPSLLQLSVSATGQLSALSSWGWTEGRANLANGLWLNTTWGWKFPAYYPFAPTYDHFPLSALKYVLPLIAFGALLLVFSARPARAASHMTRISLAAAGASLFLIVLGTGTNLPGSILFYPLYHLPYGWLLQEPGRFLMAACLGYAILTGITVELGYSRLVTTLTGGSVARKRTRTLITLPLVGMVVIALAPAYPLASGQITSPSTRVSFPRYWTTMATHINTQTPPGNLIVLPTDDFYQMPYTWGYYGNDGFILQLINRQVLDPSGQGYLTLGDVLGASDASFSHALVDKQWSLANRLLNALGTPEILLRGDINSALPGRTIVSPSILAKRLATDPFMHLQYHDGPLELFVDGTAKASFATVSPHVVTVNTTTPDLNFLTNLPPNTDLVTHSMIPGISALLQSPPIAQWHLAHTHLTTTIPQPSGWHYTLVAPLPDPALLRHGDQLVLHLGTNSVQNGTFRAGPWQAQVGNCDDVGGLAVGSAISGKVLSGAGPGRNPALRLRASTDSACEATPLSWHGGSLLLSLWTRHLAGAGPRMCIWETTQSRCASETPALPSSSSWSHTQISITPNASSGPLELYVYADVTAPGHISINEYSDVTAYTIPSYNDVALIASPDHPSSTPMQLRVAESSYNTNWTGPHGLHVLVDGMRNGWLIPAGESTGGIIDLTTTPWYFAADALSAAAVLGLFSLFLVSLLGRHQASVIGPQTASEEVV